MSNLRNMKTAIETDQRNLLAMLLTRLYQPLLWRKRPQWLFARHRLFSFRRQMVTEQSSLWSTIDHPLPFEKAKWFARWTRQRAKQSALYGSSQRSDFNFFHTCGHNVVTMWSQSIECCLFFHERETSRFAGLPMIIPWYRAGDRHRDGHDKGDDRGAPKQTAQSNKRITKE